MRISDWSSDVCSSDLARQYAAAHQGKTWLYEFDWRSPACDGELGACHGIEMPFVFKTLPTVSGPRGLAGMGPPRSEEHTSELQSLMRISYAVFCLKNKTTTLQYH